MYSYKKDWAASVPIFHIHVYVSDLYIPRIGPHIFLQQNRQTYRPSWEGLSAIIPGLFLTLLFLVSTSWEYSCSLSDADANILASTWCDELLISAKLVGARVYEAHNAIEDDHMFL